MDQFETRCLLFIFLTSFQSMLPEFLATLSVSVRGLFVPVVFSCLQIYCDTLCSSDPPPYPCRSDKSRVGRPAKISDTNLLLHFLCFSRSASSVLFIVADRKEGNERKGVTLTAVKHPLFNDKQLLRLGLKLWVISI